MEVLHYLDEDGSDPFQDWLQGLSDLRGRLAVYRRVNRLVVGNAGDHRACRSGVWELRVDVGPGYRVYEEADAMTTRTSRSHEEASIEMFRDDPGFATAYLNHILLEGSSEDLLLALRYMSEAYGGVPRLAQGAGLNPKTLYRTLSARGNPELRSLSALLRAMGMALAVQPLAGPAGKARTGTRRT